MELLGNFTGMSRYSRLPVSRGWRKRRTFRAVWGTKWVPALGYVLRNAPLELLGRTCGHLKLIGCNSLENYISRWCQTTDFGKLQELLVAYDSMTNRNAPTIPASSIVHLLLFFTSVAPLWHWDMRPLTAQWCVRFNDVFINSLKGQLLYGDTVTFPTLRNIPETRLIFAFYTQFVFSRN